MNTHVLFSYHKIHVGNLSVGIGQPRVVDILENKNHVINEIERLVYTVKKKMQRIRGIGPFDYERMTVLY